MRSHPTRVLQLLALGACQDAESPGDNEPVMVAQVDLPKAAASIAPMTRPNPFAIRRGEPANLAVSSHPEVLRLVQWNVKAGRDSSIEAIATRLAIFDADVIVLQEIDLNTRRTGQVDQTSVLGQALGLYSAFAPTIPWSGGIYGIATLSRYPFTVVDRIALSNEGVIEPRTALDTTLQLPAADLRVVNHHADTVLAAAVKSTSEILQKLEPSLGTGVALAGDFNQAPTDDGPRACVASGLIDLGQEHGNQVTDGVRRIDYVFVDSAIGHCVRSMKVEPVPDSDHQPLIVDFELSCLSMLAGI